ncbi:auxin-responsive protein IAA27-like [Salvia divinorum]|uniref:Auxin-responsive protein n=1 Tax=Salvia divinorum TaxID=28513 RepID=A0ABD1H522_SALDI
MSMPQEHDYIGLSEPLPSEKSSDKTTAAAAASNVERNGVFSLKETELRLGLPGSEAPERKGGVGIGIGIGIGVSLFGKDESKCVKSGAKRGFSDAINGAGKWGLSINGGSEVDLGQKGGVNVSAVKREIPPLEERKNEAAAAANTAPASKAQVVGWPPIRSFRKNTLATNTPKKDDVGGNSGTGTSCLYVKVSMDGAPYLRKIDLKTYCSYTEISSALEKMFSCFTIGQCGQGLAAKENISESHLMDLLHGSEYVLTYEDKDGDWMLVGDVPWEMFTDSCRRLRIMKGSDAIGLAPRTMQKCKSQN